MDRISDNDIYVDEIYRDLFKNKSELAYTDRWQEVAVGYVYKNNLRERKTPVDYLNRKLILFLDVDDCLGSGNSIDILNYGLWIKYCCPQLKDASEKIINILSEMKYFPVAVYENDDTSVEFDDSWNEQRLYGGDRKHEGCDLMALNNIVDYFPVISVCDGIVENIGWLELGGNRIGVRSAGGTYYYYAHLSSYSQDIKKGDHVFAGQLLGFMGDSGYGPEGTTGKFDVHLHFGIYIDNDGEDIAVNPYYFLLKNENNMLTYKK